MNTPCLPPKPAPAPLVATTPAISLRGHSYEDHRHIVATLVESMASCGCWMVEQRALSPTTTELRLDIQLRSVFELYSGLVCSGIELTRDSQTVMANLCTVRNQNPRKAKRRRVLSVRLEVSFLEHTVSEYGSVAIGLA
jgi:hypothetical protein